MSEKNFTLFYSNQCNFCRQFLEKLNNLQIKKNFSFYCVDNNKAPHYVRSTPTLLIKEESKYLRGKEAFEWLEKYENKIKEDSNPLAWHPAEMGSSLSDNYSFLDIDTNSQGLGGNSIAHSFSFLSNGNNMNSLKNINNNKNNNKMDQLTNKMEDLKKIRDMDTPAPIQRI